MPLRAIVTGLFVSTTLLTFATLARADVTLTDQRTFTNRTAYGHGTVTGGQQQGPVSAPLATGQVPRLIDATGLEWFINDEVTYATTSSSVGAASDAVFVGAVEATTAAGGTELSVLADAFDGYNALKVAVDGGSLTSYNNLGHAASDCNGRQIVEPTLTVGGVQFYRKVYVPANDGFARWLNYVTNPTGAAHTVTLTIVNDLGSDARTTIGTTSSGDAVASTADDWVTSYESFIGSSSRTPRLAHVLQSAGASVRTSALTFADGNDKPTWSYTFSVAPGATVLIGNFAAGLASKADAALKAAQLSALPANATQCMSTTEQQNLLNFVPGIVPTGPEPTGPAALDITSPTTDPTFQATSPFISIGGTAGAARLTGITWSSNRGFSGTAQGLTEWTVPDIPLLAGANVITVTAAYSTGASLTDSITINLSQMTYLLPEGASGGFFHTDVLLANPNAFDVAATVQFIKDDGTTVNIPTQTLPALSRTTIPVNTVSGLENAVGVSTQVTTSGAPLVVERSMFWDSTYYGSHGATAIEGARNRFIFSEGSQGFFQTFLLLENPGAVKPALVNVKFLPEGPGRVVNKTYTVAPTTRTTVYMGDIPELVNTSFSMVIDSDQPVAAERAMYFGTPLFNGGTDSAGVSLPGTKWLFAEGATGGFFDSFFLFGNAGTRTANLTMTYQLSTGQTVVLHRQVGPSSRLTINAATEDPALAATTFSLAVSSDEPITAERSMFWDRSLNGYWYEAHYTFGTLTPSLKWGLAEGRVGQQFNFHTYILLGNPGVTDATVRVTYLKKANASNGVPVGTGTVIKNYTVSANSRFTIDVNGMVPELVNEDFGAIIEVLSGPAIVVERSLYNASGGLLFAAGTNTTAVHLQ
jgi:hypothetical protein